MSRCKEVFADPYDGAPKLACDIDDSIQHDLHFDKVQGVEWRIPFLGVGVTRIKDLPLRHEVYRAGPLDPRVTVTLDE